MAKTRKFSIYLLKDEFDHTNSLKEGHNLQLVAADYAPTESQLFIQQGKLNEPWWRSYFGVGKSLSQVYNAAIFFLKTNNRTFVITFGVVAHNLKEQSYVYDFGLRVTLNSIDPEKLQTTDTISPGASQRRRTKITKGSDITYFEFDQDKTILSSLAGKTLDKYSHLFKYTSGASSLKISTQKNASELTDLCCKCYEIYKSEDFKTTFPFIQNIIPENDPELTTELDSKLIEALRRKDYRVQLSLPDVLDYRDSTLVSFHGCGRSFDYEEATFENYSHYLSEHDVDISKISLEDIRRHGIIVKDDEDRLKSKATLYATILFDAKLSKGGMYHLANGQWYRINEAYLEKLEDDISKIQRNLSLPDCQGMKEGAYNKYISEHNADMLCLDTKCISIAGHTKIESCDIYHHQKDTATLYHIKISDSSSTLSHLFNQGTNAIELLRSEPLFVNEFKGLVLKESEKKHPFTDFQALEDNKLKVVFGIISPPNRVSKQTDLPLFSKISLRRCSKHLHNMGVEHGFGFIPNTTGRPPGKKKGRKPGKKKSD